MRGTQEELGENIYLMQDTDLKWEGGRIRKKVLWVHSLFT